MRQFPLNLLDPSPLFGVADDLLGGALITHSILAANEIFNQLAKITY